MLQILITSLIIITLVNIAAYIWAYFKQSDHLTDISYSLCFIGLATFLLFTNGTLSLGRVILFLMVCLWGIRLGGFLFYRIHSMGKDYRFDEFRSSWTGFLKFWILQSVSIWIISLPIIIALSKSDISFYVIGFIVWLIGWILEAVADFQKFTFKSKPENKEKFIRTGLYSIVRHPNYLGEVLCWVGVFIDVIPVLSGWEWLTIISPIWVIVLLLFVSGLPLLDKNAVKKYSHDPDYQKYRKNTKAVFPGLY